MNKTEILAIADLMTYSYEDLQNAGEYYKIGDYSNKYDLAKKLSPKIMRFFHGEMTSSECKKCDEYIQLSKNLNIPNDINKLTAWANNCKTCAEMCNDMDRLGSTPHTRLELEKYKKYAENSKNQLMRAKDKINKDNLQKQINYWRAGSTVNDPFPKVPTNIPVFK